MPAADASATPLGSLTDLNEAIRKFNCGPAFDYINNNNYVLPFGSVAAYFIFIGVPALRAIGAWFSFLSRMRARARAQKTRVHELACSSWRQSHGIAEADAAQAPLCGSGMYSELCADM